MDISIIILNYKSKGFTLSCIDSIKKADFSGLEREIIVVDNNSEDSIAEILAWQHPDVVFVQSGKNMGMGAGNNVGIRRARGEYCVVMNPDTIAFHETFQKLYKFMESNKDVGIVGPKQLNPDKSIQKSCYRWHGLMTPIYRRTPLGRFSFARKTVDRFLMKDFNHATIKDVNWLLGSFYFCRMSALQRVGFFDERFFMYFEDTDLCRRFWTKKWRVTYFPETSIIHNHNRQSAEDPWYKFLFNRAARWHITSWFRYLWKWGARSARVKS